MAIISTFAGSGLARMLADSNGTSRWQCGHQWATPSRTLALPSPGSTFTASPLNDWPLIAGTAVPTAGSDDESANRGSGSPVTVTGRFWAPRGVVDALVLLPPPPPPHAPASTATSTAATPMMTFRLRMTLRLRRATGRLLSISSAGPRPDQHHARGNREETAAGHERRGDEAEVLHPDDAARVGDVARAGLQRRIALHEHVIDRDRHRDQGENEGIGPRPTVAAQRGQTGEQEDRVHPDALVPTEAAGREMGDLRQVQAASSCDGRDNGGDPHACRSDSVHHSLPQRRSPVPQQPCRERQNRKREG